MIWVYNILLTLTAPLWVPWMLWRTAKRKEKPNWEERAGRYAIKSDKEARRVWLHAVSVGEVVAALPILKAVRAKDSGLEIILTVTTSSGHQTARERAEGLYDHLFYLPIDVYRFTMEAVFRVKPKVIAIMETELWFNLLHTAEAFGTQRLLINGRISPRSFKRAQYLKWLYKPMVRLLNGALMQTETDAQRIKELGYPEPEVLGNCKFDEAAQALENLKDWRGELGIAEEDFVVVVGSTRSALEEQIVADAIKQARALKSDLNWRVIWAPRHLERADQVHAALGQLGDAVKRSEGQAGEHYVLDTYGELAGIYDAADLVVIGGGFDRLGGQNILQPLAHGKPVIYGPNMFNFRDAADMAEAAGASIRSAGSAEALATDLVALASNPEKRAAMSEAAKKLVASSVGASERYAERIVQAVKLAE